MHSRKQFAISATAAVSVPMALHACTATSGDLNYEDAVKKTVETVHLDPARDNPPPRF